MGFSGREGEIKHKQSVKYLTNLILDSEKP